MPMFLIKTMARYPDRGERAESFYVCASCRNVAEDRIRQHYGETPADLISATKVEATDVPSTKPVIHAGGGK